MGQLCDGSHGSWVTEDDPFPALRQLAYNPYGWLACLSRGSDLLTAYAS